MTEQKKRPMPRWAKLMLIGGVTSGAYVGGQQLTENSPVHFNVQGQAPADAPGWECKPEGGIFGAPLVCRFKSHDSAFATNTETK